MSELREWKDDRARHKDFWQKLASEKTTEAEEAKVCQAGELAIYASQGELAQTTRLGSQGAIEI
jgi:hypothetical protein